MVMSHKGLTIPKVGEHKTWSEATMKNTARVRRGINSLPAN